MNRLTKTYNSGTVTLDAKHFKPLFQETITAEISASPTLLKTVVERLYEYEDAEENGLLKWLPCKVGDTVYILAGSSNRRMLPNKYEQEVCEGFYIGDDNIIQIRVSDRKGNHATYGVMNETVFLTLEEAEQALKERENE